LAYEEEHAPDAPEDPRHLALPPVRKRTALDWMAVAVEEHGREIVEVYLQAMRKGD
jgi:hypothetical protein